MMNKGDNIVLTEPVIVTGSFGSEYLLKGTKGTFLDEQGGLAEIQTRNDSYFIPTASISFDIDAPTQDEVHNAA